MIQKERNFKLRYSNLLAKKHSHTCLYPQCQNKSISAHTISKKSVLRKISTNSFVVSNNFDIVRGALKNEEEIFNPRNEINFKFKKDKGIQDSSTFNGFCREHDNSLFASIDDNGITTIEDIFLQLYRTSSKYFFVNNMVRKAELDVLGKESFYNKKFEKMKVFNLETIIIFLENLFIEQEDQIEFKEKIVITGNQFFMYELFSLRVIYKKINMSLPLALENNFSLHKNNKNHNSLFILIPDDVCTHIIILCHEDILPEYGNYLSSKDINNICEKEKDALNKIRILNLVESIFISDSNFYLNPEYFKMWSKKKVKILEQDFYFFQERKFLEEYEVSIFDDIREEICKELPDDMKKHEMKKIGYIPHRPSIEDRIINMRILTDLNRMKKNVYTSE